jgi:NAD+ synthase (glutamine-hydrolysing)
VVATCRQRPEDDHAASGINARVNLLLTPNWSPVATPPKTCIWPAFVDACDDALKQWLLAPPTSKACTSWWDIPDSCGAGGQRRERSVSVAHLHNAASVCCTQGPWTHTYAKRDRPLPGGI